MNQKKKQLIKELVEQTQRDIWLKEIAIGFFSLQDGDEPKKKVLAAQVEIQELEYKKNYFQSLI